MKKIEEATEKETKVENVRDGKGRRGAGKEENKTRAFRPWIRRTNNTGQLWFNIADVNNNSRGGFTRSALSFSSRKKKYIMRYILKNVYHIRDVAKHAFHVLCTRKKKRYVQTFNVHGMKQFTVRMYNL